MFCWGLRVDTLRAGCQRRNSRNGQWDGTHLTALPCVGIDQRIELAHIQPDEPIQNAYAESFNGRFRDECLKINWFRNLWDARRKIAAWLVQYNQERPHSSLDYRTPNEFVQQ